MNIKHVHDEQCPKCVEVANELEEYKQLFELQRKADARAVEAWRKEDPEGRKLRLPDRAKLFLWLCEQVAKAKET